MRFGDGSDFAHEVSDSTRDEFGDFEEEAKDNKVDFLKNCEDKHFLIGRIGRFLDEKIGWAYQGKVSYRTEDSLVVINKNLIMTYNFSNYKPGRGVEVKFLSDEELMRGFCLCPKERMSYLKKELDERYKALVESPQEFEEYNILAGELSQLKKVFGEIK